MQISSAMMKNIFKNLLRERVYEIEYKIYNDDSYQNIIGLSANSFEVEEINATKYFCKNIKSIIFVNPKQHHLQYAASIRQLQKLSLYGSYLPFCEQQWVIPDWMNQMNNLKQLDLFVYNLRDYSIVQISKHFTNLQKLTLACIQSLYKRYQRIYIIRFQIIKEFLTFKVIQNKSNIYNLANTHSISQQKLKVILQTLSTINSIQFESCSFNNLNSFQYVELMTNLQCFQLNYSKLNQEKVVYDIIDLLPKTVKNICFYSIPISIEGIQIIMNKYKNLTTLLLQNCYLSDEHLQIICKSPQKLNQFSIQIFDRITKLGIVSIVKFQPQLRILNLGLCHLINNQWLKILSELKYLQSLELGGNQAITDKGLLYLRYHKHLQILKLGISNLTDECFIKITMNLKKLKKLFVHQQIKNHKKIRKQNLQVFRAWIKYN